MADNFDYFIVVEKPGSFSFYLDTRTDEAEVPPQAQEHFDKLFKFIPSILTCVGGVQFDYRIEIMWGNIVYSLESRNLTLVKYVHNPETNTTVQYTVSQTDGWMMDMDRKYIPVDPDFESFKAKLMTLGK